MHPRSTSDATQQGVNGHEGIQWLGPEWDEPGSETLHACSREWWAGPAVLHVSLANIQLCFLLLN